jgi:hypothetical protein
MASGALPGSGLPGSGLAGGVPPRGVLAGHPGPPRPGRRATGGCGAGGGCEAAHGGPPGASGGGALTAHGGPPGAGGWGSSTGRGSSISHGGLLAGRTGCGPGEDGRPDIAAIGVSSPKSGAKTHYVQLDNRL